MSGYTSETTGIPMYYFENKEQMKNFEFSNDANSAIIYVGEKAKEVLESQKEL